MYSNNFDLSVLVNGKPCQEFHKNGKTYIEAKNGSTYSIKVTNSNNRRAKVIITVDGIDVLGGETGADAKSGYIVNAYDSLDIKGYRIDDNNVAKFKFSDGKTSYAATVGPKVSGKNIPSPENNGVIGVSCELESVSFWFEGYIKEPKRNNPYPWWEPLEYPTTKPTWYYGDTIISYNSNITGSLNRQIDHCMLNDNDLGPKDFGVYSCSINNISQNSKNIPNFEAGTAWGDKVKDSVVEVSFNGCGTKTQMAIYYAFRKNLEEIGISFSREKRVFFPDPFPSKKKYCTVPKDYSS